ncbi:MAG: threonine--tRNA ligase [Candidatus Parcubacteria bacterium]|nr:threonine--tRNA ligase [Candidatus Parcubacteria bacterium]
MEKTDQLYKIRHSLAHLLAIAALEHDPNAKLTIGPVVDNGFYYDIDFSEGKAPTPEDLKKIQKTMKKLAGRKLPFTKRTLTDDEAKKMFADNPYKMELIEGIIKEGEKATVYDTGEFTDLCEGPHVENTGEIDTDAFKIDHIAGAYWRGNEKNKMLTRIYGLAFETAKDLDDYLKMIEEAKKRDHRKLGKELDLFTFSDLVGPGLPLWTPKGTVLRETLDGFVRELREKHGYQRVTIPHITKKALYETSGHWAKFSEELFKITTREGKEYAMKPMNCPHHTQIFARTQWSYRDMPQRYAETTMVYRDEQSGELGGLTRVLSITQDDAHVFARPNQIKEEFFAIWDIINTVYETFGFELRVRLSFHNPEAFEKYLGTKEVWEKAENAIREIAKERNANYFEAPGEAAMYGPKLDFMAKDSLGREHQVATIQLDMNLPERFDLFCINEKGEKERVVMIHCAIMGSIERFSAVLLEHLAGNLPFRFSPVQVYVLPITDVHEEYAREVLAMLKNADIRTEFHNESETLGKKIRNGKLQKIPYLLVIGDKEVADKTVTIESRGEETKGAVPLSELLENLK